MLSCMVGGNNRVHYISDGVYTLGTLSCAVCGHAFPINSCTRTSMSCEACGTLHQSCEGNASSSSTSFSAKSEFYAASRLFTQDVIDTLALHVVSSVNLDADQAQGDALFSESGARTQDNTRVGTIQVDNRVIEEVLCENCGVHRPCKTFARQTRSADEGQTIFFQCTVCKSEWQQNS